MQKTLLQKISIIIALCLMFGVGLVMVKSLVYERQSYAKQVNSELQQQHVYPQKITTPFIVASPVRKVCYKQKTTNNIANAANSQLKTSVPVLNSAEKCKSQNENIKIITPTETIADSDFSVSNDTYKRGVYKSTSFEGIINFKQKYNMSKLAGIKPEKSAKTQLYTRNATLLIPVSDLRGVTKMPTVKVNGTELLANYPNTPIIKGVNYLEVKLPEAISNVKNIDLQIHVPIVGMDKIQTIPLGQQFKLSMKSNWHAPKFVGDALPHPKLFDDKGFTASWQTMHLSIKNTQSLNDCIVNKQEQCDAIKSLNGFDVEFAEPNDVYLQTERSIKYGLLLIAVSFGSFFLFEIIKSLKIHPIQYLLVGMALLVFYVLLLSLAEQVAFWQAYAIAATACAGLIGWYAYYMLNSIIRAGIFTLILVAQYAGFFSILTMEEMNLVIGSVLCFILIASVMFLTRKINWYQVA